MKNNKRKMFITLALVLIFIYIICTKESWTEPDWMGPPTSSPPVDESSDPVADNEEEVDVTLDDEVDVPAATAFVQYCHATKCAAGNMQTDDTSPPFYYKSGGRSCVARDCKGFAFDGTTKCHPYCPKGFMKSSNGKSCITLDCKGFKTEKEQIATGIGNKKEKSITEGFNSCSKTTCAEGKMKSSDGSTFDAAGDQCITQECHGFEIGIDGIGCSIDTCVSGKMLSDGQCIALNCKNFKENSANTGCETECKDNYMKSDNPYPDTAYYKADGQYCRPQECHDWAEDGSTKCLTDSGSGANRKANYMRTDNETGTAYFKADGQYCRPQECHGFEEDGSKKCDLTTCESGKVKSTTHGQGTGKKCYDAPKSNTNYTLKGKGKYCDGSSDSYVECDLGSSSNDNKYAFSGSDGTYRIRNGSDYCRFKNGKMECDQGDDISDGFKIDLIPIVKDKWLMKAPSTLNGSKKYCWVNSDANNQIHCNMGNPATTSSGDIESAYIFDVS